MRRLTPFLEDFLAASLDLESDLAALPKPEGREAEWRRALVIGDLRGLYAGVGLKICSA
jgi:hypothetical protein